VTLIVAGTVNEPSVVVEAVEVEMSAPPLSYQWTRTMAWRAGPALRSTRPRAA
jgi:hypothetical protein